MTLLLQGAASQLVVQDMRRWVERAVIDLNLCPFARSVQARGQVHYAVSSANSARELLADLHQVMQELLAHDAALRDTTLLAVPYWLDDFLQFNAFVRQAQRLLGRSALDGTLQLATFHPHYEFADAAADAITNYTNRAPYPALHVLREASVARAVRAFAEPETIYQRNLRTMEQLGIEGWQQLGIVRTVGPASPLQAHHVPPGEAPT